MCPIMTSVLPSIYINYTITSCRHFPVLMIIHSLLIVTVPLINSVTTLVFVRPYRRTLMKWLNLVGKTAQVKDGTTDMRPQTKDLHSVTNDHDTSLNVF